MGYQSFSGDNLSRTVVFSGLKNVFRIDKKQPPYLLRLILVHKGLFGSLSPVLP